jgi:uncharacterized protein (UPF0305 family)
MIAIYLSSHALAAARSVDPRVSAAAVHAAVEVAVVEQLRELRNASAEEIQARAARIEQTWL